MVYLDYASHSPVSKAALDALIQAENRYIGNPMSKHTAGQMAKDELSRITGDMADFLQVQSSEIIFTSGASEANNLAIKGIARAYSYKGRHILSTPLEHPSVSGALAFLQDEGYEIELLRIMPDGKIDLEYLDKAIRPDTVLVCVSAVDSELGVIQPLAEISEIIARHPSCHLHIDAAQAMGKIHVSMAGASTLSFSSHKFYGICGSGVLVKREGVVLEPLVHGGASTSIYRSGTPAVGLAASCLVALEVSLKKQSCWHKSVVALREYLLNAFNAYPLVRINSPHDGSPYILNLSVKGVKGTRFVEALDKQGICASVKSACSTDNAPSRPVMAVSRDKQNALNSWRVSLSHMTTLEELDIFVREFERVYCKLTQ
ncbi:MAG: cysteine desulfurase [Defluviitaleaceae bacterium]|nr:cysteine desulfurase [Defluviitaleaceae bacterium]